MKLSDRVASLMCSHGPDSIPIPGTAKKGLCAHTGFYRFGAYFTAEPLK